MYSIVERLAILEGRISPVDSKPITETKQKKPVLFNNLRKISEDFTPMVGGVEFAEDTMEEDILSKVKSSLVDYLQSANADLAQDKDLLDKKKQNLDFKKKELKDLALQTKPNKNLQDVEEDPSQTPAGGEAPAGLSNNIYAENHNAAPIKSVHIPVGEEVGLSGGGGSVLVEIYGDERDGFHIQRAGKKMRRRFKTLDECQLALEMYMAHRRTQKSANDSADYIEEV
jgi:hypothetical protein